MAPLTQDERFARRVRELASQLDERVRVAQETVRMAELAMDEGSRRAAWFVHVAGTGHGCRPGTHRLLEPPGELLEPTAREARLVQC